MENKVKVSVIIPVYQVENYLERAVDSVLAQTLKEVEIILVDDGSEDASPQICDRYAKEYPEQIRVIHKQNEGLGLARNTGVDAAAGEYVAFLDSDDTVEPEMYEELYGKAQETGCDIVMCDVRIIREEEQTTSVSVTYPSPQIDLADYIASGNNITYSVNKLYRRFIWQENRYEKMLFEDIALIPALITRYPNIAYVPRPFYNYYRRANTISTTFTGAMVDIIQAFRNFIDRSNPLYREEVVYCIARQIYWNMFQSRILFQADFVELLGEYRKDFLLNPYIEKDAKVRRLLEYAQKEVIPERFICVHIQREIPQEYLERIREEFPKAELLDVDERYLLGEADEKITDTAKIRQAIEEGHTEYAEEYLALKILYERGGIVLFPQMRANLNLKKLRMNRIFFGFEDTEQLETGCFGALKEHYVIRALLDSYETDQIYNKAFLPLKERLRDFLIIHFNLRVNGKNQLLKKEIQIYLPSILSYDMKNGENCCKKAIVPAPEGYEVVSGAMLKLWSDQLMENWNLYKQERNCKAGQPAPKPAPVRSAADTQALFAQELEERIQEVVNNYENSTCWRITRPIRALSRLFGLDD